MIYTRKSITTLPHTINRNPIDYVREIKFLGVIFDGPYLDWKRRIRDALEGQRASIGAGSEKCRVWGGTYI
jgi:hypothetical protein